ncbi:BtpA/SgcQ family protein [Virgibacillus necropolis]|uniref:Membrane biogenesis protein n=1 Tax=Virgibacillus necropolis TaxID=163877 RepID=A0A221M9F4_9BACI|nr:BtpA/SgcQ family protein [Virgibacillus necropolis]ASN04259.1 membrane biogenesis protein [Virgibacillus necropolis]
MKHKRNFLDLFEVEKPILAMIHLKGDNDEERLKIAKCEIDLLIESGVDGLIVENYFGSVANVEEVLKYLHKERNNIVYGVNVLGDYKSAFELADCYGVKYIQIDSVAGHLNSADDSRFHKHITSLRESTNISVLGGVRFKYQPYLSGRSLEEDLHIGMDRCDSMVVTGKGTGIETDLNKINQFRDIMGSNFPLIVGAGLTVENCAAQISLADAAIVGSYLKDTGNDDGNVSLKNAKAFMNEVERLRKMYNLN